MIDEQLRAQAELELRRRYHPARTTMEGFIRRTKPDMDIGWFVKTVCNELDEFLERVLSGDQPRLMLIAPPRHGKSECVSRRFPSYVFGRFPKWHFMSCSYAADLAGRMNRDVQRVIDNPVYRRVFPNTTLNTQNVATLSGQPLRNSEIFEIVNHLGSYRGAGVGQGITGMGFDIGAIDDPVKDAADANSEKIRESQWEWYESTFYTRASPKSGILLVMTRWHEDDMGGRILHKMQYEGGEQWKVVRFPAIAEEDEEFRREGEPLHPERFPLERLEAIRKTIGSYAFSALYQGSPTPKGGGIVDRDDFGFYKRADMDIHAFNLIAITVDAAFKDTTTSAYVAIQAWGRDRNNRHWLIKQKRARLTFTNTVKELLIMRNSLPFCNAVLIEDKANGTAIIDVLGKRIPGVIPIEPIGSKEARAQAAAPIIESGCVLVPHPDEEPWVEQFIKEWCSVPTGAFWDQVDASGQYLLKFAATVTPVNLDGVVVGGSVATSDQTPWAISSGLYEGGPGLENRFW